MKDHFFENERIRNIIASTFCCRDSPARINRGSRVFISP